MSNEMIPATRVRDAIADSWRWHPSWLRVSDLQLETDALREAVAGDAIHEIETILGLDCEPYPSIGRERMREVYRDAVARTDRSGWSAHVVGIVACMAADPVWAGEQVDR